MDGVTMEAFRVDLEANLTTLVVEFRGEDLPPTVGAAGVDSCGIGS